MPEKGIPPAKTNAAKIKIAETKAKDKQARLAGALRENLRRRKAQERGKTQERGKNGGGEESARRPAPIQPGEKTRARDGA